MAQLLGKRVKPLFDRVLIKRLAVPKKTSGGLYLPETASTNELPQGIVQAVGPGVRNEQGVLQEMVLKAGDQVIIPQYGGQEFKVADDEFVLCREHEIVATVDPEE